MGDRFNYYHEEMLKRLDDILDALKRQSTYNSHAGNIFLVGGVNEVAGVSGALGGIEILHDLYGTIAATSSASGNMLTTWGAGLAGGVSSAVASLNLSKALGGGLVAAVGSVANTELCRIFALAGICAAPTGGASGAMTVNNANLAGSVSVVSEVTGYLQGGTPSS